MSITSSFVPFFKSITPISVLTLSQASILFTDIRAILTNYLLVPVIAIFFVAIK